MACYISNTHTHTYIELEQGWWGGDVLSSSQNTVECPLDTQIPLDSPTNPKDNL